MLALRKCMVFSVCCLGLAACPESPTTEACPAQQDGLLHVGGEAIGINGPVTVEVGVSGDRVSLQITPASGEAPHTATFTLAGADLDDLVGAVTAEVGAVFAGEGTEYGYLRLLDERGVWFEGGHSGSIDGEPQGGSTIDGPFELGEESGDPCRLGGADGYDVTVHSVLADFGGGAEATPVGEAGADATWRGVDVRAMGVRAHRGVDEEPENTADGLGPGEHDVVGVDAYLYRVVVAGNAGM